MKKLLLLVMLLSITGCGYRFGCGELLTRFETVSIPYAEGDFDGSFTTELIKQMSTTGCLRYERTGGDLILKVRLIDFNYENIGFRYYRNKKNELTSETIPVETRLFLTAEIALIDACSGDCIVGPVHITATTDFDHDYYFDHADYKPKKVPINVFSMGQLTDYDEALDAAKKPLHYNLSRKIVDFVSDSW